MALKVQDLKNHLRAVKQAESTRFVIVEYAARVTKGTSTTAARAAKLLLLSAYALQSGCDEAKLETALAEHDWSAMEDRLGEVINGSQLSEEQIWSRGKLSFKHLGVDIAAEVSHIGMAARHRSVADNTQIPASGDAPLVAAAPRAPRPRRRARDQDGSGGESTAAPVASASLVKRKPAARKGSAQRGKRACYGGNRAMEELLTSTLQKLQQRGGGNPHLPELVVEIADALVKSEHLTGGTLADRLIMEHLTALPLNELKLLVRDAARLVVQREGESCAPGRRSSSRRSSGLRGSQFLPTGTVVLVRELQAWGVVTTGANTTHTAIIFSNRRLHFLTRITTQLISVMSTNLQISMSMSKCTIPAQ